MEDPLLMVTRLFGGQMEELESEIVRLTAKKKQVEQTYLSVLQVMAHIPEETGVKELEVTPEIEPEVEEEPTKKPEFPARVVYTSETPASRNTTSELVTLLFDTGGQYTVPDICKELGVERYKPGTKLPTPQAGQIANRVSYLKVNGLIVKIGSRNGHAILRKARPGEVDSEHLLQRKYHGRTPREELQKKKEALIAFLTEEGLTRFNARMVVNRVEAANRKDLKFGTTHSNEASRVGALLWRMGNAGMIKQVKKGVYALI